MIKHPLFNCLSSDDQNKLLTTAKKIELKRGQGLFFESDDAHYVYYVLQGHIKVYKTSIEGNETIFNVYPQNTFVALGVLFKDEQIYPASGSAAQKSVVVALDIKLLEDAILNNKESSKKWINYMNNRLMTVQSMLSDQIFADGMKRLNKLIHYFYENYPHKEMGDYIKIHRIPITKQEMAELLNIRRETLSRMLSSLKGENICEYTNKEIIVKKDWLLKKY